jgi:hypothetical protein
MTHEERLEAARAFRVNVLDERDRLLMRLFDAEAARDALHEFIDTPDWATLDGVVPEGTITRFGALRYRAKSTHNKALTRSPLNLLIWEMYSE